MAEEKVTTGHPSILRRLQTNIPAYAATGGLAGLASSSTFQAYTRLFIPSSPPPSSSQLFKALSHGVGSSALRFGGFSTARIGIQSIASSSAAESSRLTKVLQTGLAGGAGGAFEATVLSLMTGGLNYTAIARQGSRVGICFTAYAACVQYSPTHDPSGPPPFPTALLYGTLAGAVGSSILYPFESSASFWKGVKGGIIPRAALAIGVVISVQNEAVRAVLG